MKTRSTNAISWIISRHTELKTNKCTTATNDRSTNRIFAVNDYRKLVSDEKHKCKEGIPYLLRLFRRILERRTNLDPQIDRSLLQLKSNVSNRTRHTAANHTFQVVLR